MFSHQVFFSWKDLYLTQCAIGPHGAPGKWHVNSSNCLSRLHECDRQTTDHITYRL